VLASVGAAALGQVMQLRTLLRWRRRKRDASLARAGAAAAIAALAQALPLSLVALAVPWPEVPQPGLEWLCALIAATMAVLAADAARIERRLAGALQAPGVPAKAADPGSRSALADPLTGLLSRIGLETALRKAAAEAEAQGQRITLLAIGLDGFRSVNDSFGHALGDSVLREVARRLVDAAGALHEPPKVIGHHVARLGGDEFMLMLQGHVDRQQVGRAAGRLLEALDGPVTCDEHELTLAASIGVASFPEHGGATKLISRANAAMHAAKEAGGSTYMTFEPRMQDDARDRHELLRDLRHAIENRQLELFYQPKIDARSGQVTAAEALLRWHHPVRGTLSPELFIPLAERHGLIGALGNWVIDDACRQARVWRQRGLKMRVAINLSVFQMRQSDLVERIQAALKRYGVNPQRLTCEITESVAMEDTQVTQRTFERLGKAGIHLSIDDFGTGYSSLSYLRRLPATELKIDRSFIMDLETSPDARAIVDAVLKLAHAIGLKVVAEGVENVRQRDILLELGCDEFQGYLFARPMSARALLLWAVDDRPGKTAFRPSLFGETDVQSMQAMSTQQASILPLRRRP
ncbi:MAG TPA: bifunctional diguanylate cyclase/phosphodiesterase, partial [Albitalea sp.]